MKFKVVAIAGVLAFGLTACGGGSSPLIGEWSLAPGANCPLDHLTFTAHSYTEHMIAVGPYPANESTHAVSYSFEKPDKAIVQGEGTGAGASIYRMPDNDHIQSGETPGCAYVRAK